ANASRAFNRRLREHLSKGGVVETGEIGKPGGMQFVTLCQPQLMAGARELVPRTDRQAIIAAVDAVADGRAQVARDGPLVLDGEIRDAAARIEPVRRGERRRGADVDAGTATAAVIDLRCVRRQVKRGEDRAEE